MKRSYQIRISDRSRKAGRFITRVHREIQKAFAEVSSSTGMTQRELAEKVGVDRSTMNKRLLGEANLTLRTVAELAWALDRDIDFKLHSRRKAVGRNYTQHAMTASTGSDKSTFPAAEKVSTGSQTEKGVYVFEESA